MGSREGRKGENTEREGMRLSHGERAGVPSYTKKGSEASPSLGVRREAAVSQMDP